MSTDRILANIEAIVSEIERLEQSLGFSARQAEDYEAHEIVARIERKIVLGTSPSPELQKIVRRKGWSPQDSPAKGHGSPLVRFSSPKVAG